MKEHILVTFLWLMIYEDPAAAFQGLLWHKVGHCGPQGSWTKCCHNQHGLNSTCLISCDGLFDSQGPKISLSISLAGGMEEQYLTTNGVKVKHTKYDQAYLSFVWSFVPMALAAWVFFLLLGQLRQGKLCPCESHARKHVRTNNAILQTVC